MKTYKEAKERAKELDSKLTAKEFNYGYRVFVHHEDGTTYNFNYASCLKEENWYYIFTEHHGTYVFSDDEVQVFNYNMDLD